MRAALLGILVIVAFFAGVAAGAERQAITIDLQRNEVAECQKALDSAVRLNAECVSQAEQDAVIVRESITRLIVCEGIHR